MVMDYFRTFINDLCQYYNVDHDEAIKLGSRGDGRKPSLPGSKTCDPITDMTYEDIWAIGPRDTKDEIFQFYRDQGAWSTFRQVVRHGDLLQFHMNIIKNFFAGNWGAVQTPLHIVEYGCGVAPFSRTILEVLAPGQPNFKISISDVEGCEHFLFANWRLNNTISSRGIDVTINQAPVTPDKLPQYTDPIDFVILFEVLEHVPSPVGVISNLHTQMKPGAALLENFIEHEPNHNNDGPDLASAAIERNDYYKFLRQNFTLITGNDEIQDPHGTRIWIKNKG